MRRIGRAIRTLLTLFLFVFLVAAAIQVLFPGVAMAGVGSWLQENIINQGVAFLLVIVGAIWGVTWRQRAKEFLDIFVRYWQAKQQDSAGGTEVTTEEWKQLAEEFAQFIMAMFPSYFGTRIKTQARLTAGDR